MKCPIPNCRKPALVLDSRQSDDTERRRRYRCTQGHRFTTSERVVGKEVASGADGVDEFGGVEVDRDTDGELLIDWSPGQGRMVTLSLRADGRLSYAFTWDDEKAHGTAQMPPAAGVMGDRNG